MKVTFRVKSHSKSQSKVRELSRFWLQTCVVVVSTVALQQEGCKLDPGIRILGSFCAELLARKVLLWFFSFLPQDAFKAH